MSVQSEITRIQEARNTLRAKAVSLGIGLSTDNLSQLAVKYDGIADRGTPSASVQEGDTYTIQPGYYHGGTVQGVAGGGNYSLQAKQVTPSKSEQSVTADNGYYGISTVTVNPIPSTYQDVTSVTATAADVLATKVIVDSDGNVVAGTMNNRGAWTGTLTGASHSITVPAGYHNGSGSVSISTESKTFTPTKATQTYTVPNASSTFVDSITVNPIPDDYADASDADISAADVLAGKTAIGYDSTNEEAVEIEGTMPNRGAWSFSPTPATTSATVPAGYHNGTGTVSVTLEEKTYTPTEETQTYTVANNSSTFVKKITVNPIPDKYMDASTMTATAANLLQGETAIGYNSSTGKAVVLTGTMTNNGTWNATPTVANPSITIPAGYHNGSGTASVVLETKTFTPSEETQTYTAANNSNTFVKAITVNPIPSNYMDASGADVAAGDILTGKTAIGYDSTTGEAVEVEGSMPNRGAVSQTLQAGQSYTILAGYHNGSGTVTAATLASQTGVDTGKSAIESAYVLTGYQGWVNGTKVTGSMANNGAISGTITGLGSVAGDTSYTIPAGYTTGGTVSLTTDIETALAAI